MTTSAPPRPPSERATPDSKPLERDEIEALVEALIEEARRETRRRHRTYWALAALVTFVGIVVLILLEGGAASQTASPAFSARMNAAAQAGTSRIAFTSFPADHPQPPPPTLGTSEVYVVNADGSEKRLLARSRTFGDGGPDVVWSPDGQTIAFHGHNRVVFVNADGSGRRNVTRELGLDGSAYLVARRSQDRVHERPRQRARPRQRRRHLRHERRRKRGSEVDAQRRTGMGLVSDLVAERQKIVFQRVQPPPKPPYSNPKGWKFEVWVMNPDGGGKRRLARGFPSAWSPDGQKIAFTERLGAPGLYVMNADGSGQRRLTRKRRQPHLVARRAEDRLPQTAPRDARQGQRHLRDERRREHTAQADARP